MNITTEKIIELNTFLPVIQGKENKGNTLLTENVVSVKRSANVYPSRSSSINSDGVLMDELSAVLARRNKDAGSVRNGDTGKGQNVDKGLSKIQREIAELKLKHLAEAPERERKEKLHEQRVCEAIKKEVEQLAREEKLKSLREVEALEKCSKIQLDSSGIPVPPPPPPVMLALEKTAFSRGPGIKNKGVGNQDDAKSKAMVNELKQMLLRVKKADWDPDKENKENKRVAAARAEEAVKASLQKAREAVRIKPINVVMKLDSNGIPVPPPPPPPPPPS